MSWCIGWRPLNKSFSSRSSSHLSANSPDLHPMEQFWPQLKNNVARERFKDDEKLQDRLFAAARKVTACQALCVLHQRLFRPASYLRDIFYELKSNDRPKNSLAGWSQF
ncbi:hypothetical protein DM01DRAFT_1402619 [Hesseltinella vesiculosa]|uniref:Tc1-like transposase DDE domain-containing protein n=1 Tax=Hesseltinella vesiculosa TaxID=101127 RepID=A0A1X2GMK7_9FUNG|nr:hypothetical protein DM01DRAFT_1402619 [Hesseltinella vesiculosa]